MTVPGQIVSAARPARAGFSTPTTGENSQLPAIVGDVDYCCARDRFWHGGLLRLRNLDDWARPANRRPGGFLSFQNIGEADSACEPPQHAPRLHRSFPIRQPTRRSRRFAILGSLLWRPIYRTCPFAAASASANSSTWEPKRW
jgi:hypothetical protein